MVLVFVKIIIASKVITSRIRVKASNFCDKPPTKIVKVKTKTETATTITQKYCLKC
jgi:hypothetical protein